MTTSLRPVATIGRAVFRRLVAIRSDALHPWRYITGAAGRGSAFGGLKRLAVWLLYEYMARTYSQADWTTMNYAYAVLPGEDGRAAAMKKASNLPRSSVCAKLLRCLKLKFASGNPPG